LAEVTHQLRYASPEANQDGLGCAISLGAGEPKVRLAARGGWRNRGHSIYVIDAVKASF
jgi:hypothetical protein